MSEKKVGKRLLTWVLVLVMTLSLLPLNVLADAGDDSLSTSPPVYGEYVNGEWKKSDSMSSTINTPAPNVDYVTKEATPTGNPNEYNIKLEVKMHTTTTTQTSYAQAATVLVIDTSSSMSYCLLPEHEHTDSCYISTGVLCDGHHPGNPKVYTHKLIGYIGDTCIRDEQTGKYYKATLGCGLTEHTHSSPGILSSGCGANGNSRLDTAKTAAIDFLDSYRAGGTGRYVALVHFSTGADVVAEWHDVSNKQGYDAILTAISNLKADGGTNLEQGLDKAQGLLGNSAVANIASKNIIALTDGKPTYYNAPERHYTSDKFGNYFYPDGDGQNCDTETFMATQRKAGEIHAKGYSLYSICFGAANEEVTVPNTNAKISLLDYLGTYIAPSKTYSAGDFTGLKNAFDAISKDITTGLSSGTVHDSLPAGVTCTDSNFEENWNLTGAAGVPGEGGVTTYTYTKTYTVTIDPTDKAVAGKDYYPLNGRTALTVKDKNNEYVTIDFPIPAGKVTLPVPEYTLTFDANGGSWTELSDGSAYTLNENKDEATQKVAANSKPAVVSPIPVKSGFTFDGWYLENDRLYVDFVPIGNSDMTLVAHWKPTTTKTYTVIYTDGLTANKAFEDQSTGNLSLGDKTPEFDGTPTRSGYVFTGWTPTVAEEVEDPKDGSTVITYTATWEVDNWNSNDNSETDGDGIPDKYQALVKFLPGDPNGEVGGKTTQVITMPNNDKEYVSKVKLGSVEGFEVATTTPKSDFEFNVWTMNKVTDENEDEAKTAVTPKDVTVKAGSKTTFFAHFKSIPTTYTVTYTDGVDGEEIFADKVNRDLHYKDPTPNFGSDPTRDGYTFAGWEPTVADQVTGNATYTAKWTANDAKITFVTNGGSAVADKDGKTGATIDPRTMPSTSKSGYTFAGWFGNKELTGDAVAELPKVFPAGTTTYYAKWTHNYTPRPYTPPTVVIPDDDALGLNTTDHFAYIVGYGNGEVRPQNNITRAEVATIFFRLLTDDVRDENLTKTNRYSDVAATSWYNTAVSTLSSMGIITGYPDGTFRPNAAITRAEFAAIAARFDNDGDKTAAKFSDIATHWARDEISIAYNNGWITGYPDGTFGPQRDITRAETMTLVNRVLNRQPETEDDLLPNMTVWTDNANPKAWYYLAVQEATNSHYYKFKTNSKYEKWTELRETRDWTQLEK